MLYIVVVLSSWKSNVQVPAVCSKLAFYRNSFLLNQFKEVPPLAVSVKHEEGNMQIVHEGGAEGGKRSGALAQGPGIGV